MEFAFNTRCKDANTHILNTLVSLRHQAAQLLGFDTHADYRLAIRMAKSPANVRPFLDSLVTKLEPLAQQDLEVLQK